MLSLFPDLFSWSWYVPFVFRLFLGAYLLAIGWRAIRGRLPHANPHEPAWRYFGLVLLLFAACLLFGLYTQVLGAIGFVTALFTIYFKKRGGAAAHESEAFYILFALVSLSLIFLGAGPYAVDLPL